MDFHQLGMAMKQFLKDELSSSYAIAELGEKLKPGEREINPHRAHLASGNHLTGR